MSSGWVDAAQIASGAAAVAALVFAATTVRASRRAPLADSYLRSWETILDVVVEASNTGPLAPDVDRAEQLLRDYRSADDRLAVIEAALGVKAYGREIRHDVSNILIDVLFEDTETRTSEPVLFTEDFFPAPGWADPGRWRHVGASVAISCLLCNHIFDRPGNLGGGKDDMFRWYAPRVMKDLENADSVYSPLAEPQFQLARLLHDYHNEFLLPWVRNATREALLGRRGLAGHRQAWSRYRHRRKIARRAEQWRKRNNVPPAITSHSRIFEG